MASLPSVKDIRSINRYVTGHCDDGTTKFLEEVTPEVTFKGTANGAQFALCYATSTVPVILADDSDVCTYEHYAQNLRDIIIPGGTVLRVVDFPPGDVSPMHRTISLDYGVVLEGEVQMTLDSGESRMLRRGDILIQRGTNHEWRNMSFDKWARMLYVLLPVENLIIGGQSLTDNTDDTI